MNKSHTLIGEADVRAKEVRDDQEFSAWTGTCVLYCAPGVQSCVLRARVLPPARSLCSRLPWLCSKLERGEGRGGGGRGKERLEEKGREKAGKLFNLKSRISAKNIHTPTEKVTKA